MRLVVTGREGQVVSGLLERASHLEGVDVVALGRPEFDLVRPDLARAAILAARPDVVVSAAAYTAVDRAEDEVELAHAVNCEGAEAVAVAANELSVPVIHLSTDYVFSGEGTVPYSENDETAPQGVYGRTKLDGETAVRAANPRHVILRTAWVYSPFGKNFVRTMLRLAADRDEIAVVSDQWGNPTSAFDIADGILHVASRIGNEDSTAYGIFHLTGEGAVNWSGFANAVMAASRAHGGPSAVIKPIATADYPTPARRPANSRLSTRKLEKTYGWRAPDWRVSLENVVSRLVSKS